MDKKRQRFIVNDKKIQAIFEQEKSVTATTLDIFITDIETMEKIAKFLDIDTTPIDVFKRAVKPGKIK